MTESLHARICLRAGLLLKSQTSFFWVRSCYMHTIVVPWIHFKSGTDRFLPLSQLLPFYWSAFQSVLVASQSCKHPSGPGAVKCLWCVLLSWLYRRSHHCIINSSLYLFKAHSCLWKSFMCENIRFLWDRVDCYTPSCILPFLFSALELGRGSR